MKKIIALVAVSIICICSCFGQDFKRNELSLGYGAVLETDFIDVLVMAVEAIGGETKRNNFTLGSINAGYCYNFNKVLGIGATMSYSMNSYQVWNDEQKLGREQKNYYTIMPVIKANWFNRDKIKLYSYLGAGAIVYHYNRVGEDDSDGVIFAFQLSPIGIELGGNWSFYGELGVGQMGSFGAGVRYKF